MLTFKDVTKDEHLVSPKQLKYKRGMHPNSRKNLLGPRWQKGQSGNPNGYSLTAALKDALRKPYSAITDADRGTLKVGDVLVISTMEGAILREPTPFHEVWNRLEGKLQDTPPPSPAPGSQVLNIIVVGGSDNLKDILAQVKERTKQLAIGE